MTLKSKWERRGPPGRLKQGRGVFDVVEQETPESCREAADSEDSSGIQGALGGRSACRPSKIRRDLRRQPLYTNYAVLMYVREQSHP